MNCLSQEKVRAVGISCVDKGASITTESTREERVLVAEAETIEPTSVQDVEEDKALKQQENQSDKTKSMDVRDKDWNTPTKIIRSPGRNEELSYGEISIMSNSFSCLSEKGGKG